MKVLLINGSPNANGCTNRALTEVAKTLREEGVDTEIFQIGNRPVWGCNGCNAVKAGIAAISSLILGLYFIVQLPSG